MENSVRMQRRPGVREEIRSLSRKISCDNPKTMKTAGRTDVIGTESQPRPKREITLTVVGPASSGAGIKTLIVLAKRSKCTHPARRSLRSQHRTESAAGWK